ncbi:MAG: hypothetical protein WCO12_01230 [bacterium]
MKKILFPLFVFLCLFTFTPQTHAATKYWYSASSTNWATSTNWFLDINLTAPTVVATSGDYVVLLPGSVAPVLNLSSSTPPDFIESRLTGDAGSAGFVITGSGFFSATTSGNVNFKGSVFNNAYITGNVVFNDSSRNNNGIISGSAIFNNSALNSGDVLGSVTFNDGSVNTAVSAFGSTTGSVIFNGNSRNVGQIRNNAIFNGSSTNAANITGNAVFNNNSYNDGGTIEGNATFNTTWYNNGSNSANNGTFTVSGHRAWNYRVGGTVYGSDGLPVNEFFFKDFASNFVPINKPSYFLDFAKNYSSSLSETATFCGDNSEDVGGTAQRMRYYSSDCTQSTTTRNFVSSVPWVVSADGVRVNMASSTYNASTTFTAINGGSFIPSNLVPTGLSISNPATSTTVTSWAPVINWGDSTSFAYSFDDTDYVDLASATSSIPAPTFGQHVLSIRGTNSTGITIVSSSFTYSQPVVVNSGGGSSGGSSHGGGGGGGGSAKTTATASTSVSTLKVPVTPETITALKQELTKQLIAALQELLKQLIAELAKLQAAK